MIPIQTEFTRMTAAWLKGLQFNYPSVKNIRNSGFKKFFWVLSDISLLKEPASVFLVVLNLNKQKNLNEWTKSHMKVNYIFETGRIL